MTGAINIGGNGGDAGELGICAGAASGSAGAASGGVGNGCSPGEVSLVEVTLVTDGAQASSSNVSVSCLDLRNDGAGSEGSAASVSSAASNACSATGASISCLKGGEISSATEGTIFCSAGSGISSAMGVRTSGSAAVTISCAGSSIAGGVTECACIGAALGARFSRPLKTFWQAPQRTSPARNFNWSFATRNAVWQCGQCVVSAILRSCRRPIDWPMPPSHRVRPTRRGR
jgi:hypothetical protein